MKELDMFSIEKRRQRGDMITLFKSLKDCHTEEGQDQSSIILECKTHNNGLKLQEARFWLNIRKKFLTVKSSTTMEPTILQGGECSNTGGLQEKGRQPPGRYPLIRIPALSRGLASLALQAPSNSIILGFYVSQDWGSNIFCYLISEIIH